MTLHRITRLLLGLVGLGTVYALAWPQALGGPVAYLPVSGESMLPTIENHDLAVVRRSGDYGVGDVIAYRVPEGDIGEGAVVIHRIVEVRRDGTFVTQGDNRQAPDTWHPRSSDVLGEHWYHLPDAGSALSWLRAPLPIAILAALLATWIALGVGKGDDDEQDVGTATEHESPAWTATATAVALGVAAVLVPVRRK